MGHLAGSVSGACDSWSQVMSLSPTMGIERLLKNKIFKKKEFYAREIILQLN